MPRTTESHPVAKPRRAAPKKSARIPVVRDYMTIMPHTIGADQSLAKAQKMMREHQIRHLPVLDGGQLVGVLSERDIRLVESLQNVNLEEVGVSEAYTPEPYVTSSDAGLDEVCQMMVQHKYGCALVMDDHKLTGIFTWIDALSAIDQILGK